MHALQLNKCEQDVWLGGILVRPLRSQSSNRVHVFDPLRAELEMSRDSFVGGFLFPELSTRTTRTIPFSFCIFSNQF
jgi:hypothetical protein